MPIKIKTPPPAAVEQSPHAQAAAEYPPIPAEDIATETMTVTGEGGVLDQQADVNTTHVLMPPTHERMRVGMSFKMPVAPYTMVEFRVERDVPVAVTDDIDAAFDLVKGWVEARINELVEEQQSALPDDGSVLPQE